jgi:hypothetical protein
MAKPTISADKLSDEIQQQLGLYQQEVLEAVNAAGERAIKKLVKLTRDSAPVRTGGYYKAITSKTISRPSGNQYIWGAGSRYGRLTHLLVKGHPTGNGGRTTGDPFLADALDVVLPEYEKEVEEAINNVE